MRRTATTLADGRELIYFDDDGTGAPRELRDTRVLAPHAPATDLRFDVLVDEWVAVAADVDEGAPDAEADVCPLCPSAPGRATEIPADAYDVAVFESRFPAFWERARPQQPGDDDVALIRRPGAGRCEVVCFSDAHDASFAELSPGRVRTVLEAWIDRTLALSALPGVEQVAAFENRGQALGVSLEHPHGHIFGYPFVTPRTGQMLDAARRHRERTGGDLFTDIVAAEERSDERVVARSEHWIAFVPAAARWPVEIHVFPRRAVRDLPALAEDARADFGGFYLDVLRRLDALYGMRMPYVAAWHQAPVRAGDDCRPLHLVVHSVQRSETKIKYLAGSEAAMGAFINDVAPERTAALLRAPAPSRRSRVDG